MTTASYLLRADVAVDWAITKVRVARSIEYGTVYAGAESATSTASSRSSFVVSVPARLRVEDSVTGQAREWRLSFAEARLLSPAQVADVLALMLIA